MIREIFLALTAEYGASTVYGVHNGFWGMWSPEVVPLDTPGRPAKAVTSGPTLLTFEFLDGVQHLGGSILSSDRGGSDDPSVIVRFLQHYRINQLYVIGGDGSHRGAALILKNVLAAGLAISVVGLPKTIDNDVSALAVAAKASSFSRGAHG